MFHAQPATACADAFERLHLFMRDPPTPFDIRRLEADAAKLENSDRSEASTVRAAIAALRWDVSDARRWSEKACLSDGSATTRINASVTFRFLNQLEIASEYALQAYRLAPLDVEVAQHTVGMLSSAGRLREALECFTDYLAKVGSGASWDLDVAQLVSVLDASNISEAQLRSEVMAAMGILTDARIRYSNVQYEVATEPDGGYAIAAKVQFVGDIDTEIRLESALAHKLADMPEWDPTRLSVEFEYLTEDDHAGVSA
jgi:hypothetical protein